MNFYFDTLHGGTELFQGGCLISRNNAYFLRVEETGTIAIYASSHFHEYNKIWCLENKNANVGQEPYTLSCQTDGKIYIFDKNKKIINEFGNGEGKVPFRLVLKIDGNLSIFDANNVENQISQRKKVIARKI